MKTQLKTYIGTLMILCMVPGLALAACDINGVITASPNPDPLGPAWKYTAVITWDTGSRYALSHMGLILDGVGGTCSCQDFHSAISFGSPIGYSTPGCTASYQGELNCQGDPSIPGLNGVVLKFEPDEGACEPGTTGVGTFVFYSNLGPAPIDEDILSVVDKFAGNYCYGHLSGDFPSMACNPVSDAPSSWGVVKGMFR